MRKKRDAYVKADHYVDDLKIPTPIVWEHNKQVDIVVRVLDIFGFKLKVQKLQLLKFLVKFLDHQILQGKYRLKKYKDKVHDRIPIIEGRQTLQKALG